MMLDGQVVGAGAADGFDVAPALRNALLGHAVALPRALVRHPILPRARAAAGPALEKSPSEAGRLHRP